MMTLHRFFDTPQTDSTRAAWWRFLEEVEDNIQRETSAEEAEYAFGKWWHHQYTAQTVAANIRLWDREAHASS